MKKIIARQNTVSSIQLNFFDFLFVSFLSVWLLPLSAQDTIRLDDFAALSVIGNIEVELLPGTENKAIIHADAASEERLSVFVKRGVLKLHLLNPWFQDHRRVRIELTYQQLEGIRAMAGTRVYSSAPISGDRLEIRAASGAEVDLEVNVSALKAYATEGGQLALRGHAQRQKSSAATGGQYDAYNLESDQTYIKATTGGTAVVTAHEVLEASANTGGEIKYRGNPERRNTRTLFSGEVRKI